MISESAGGDVCGECDVMDCGIGRAVRDARSKGHIMGLGIIVVPLFLYLALVTPLCVKVGEKTSERTGWLMAAGLVVPPVALFIALLT
ncbi:hypothetical protein [Streptomyces sp. NPDC055140]